LLEKLRVYHAELRTKNKEKYFPMLNLLVEQQIRAVNDGLTELAQQDRDQMRKEAVGILDKLTKAQANVRKEVGAKAFNKLSADDKLQRLDAITTEAAQLRGQLKGDAPVGAVTLEKVLDLKKTTDQVCQAITQELGDEVKTVWPSAEKLWKQAVQPIIIANLNKAIAKSNNVILKVTPDQLTTAALAGVYAKFAQDFPNLREKMKNPALAQTKLKELKDFHDFRLPYIEEAVQLLNNEIAKVEKAKADSALFQYAPLDVDQ